MARVQLINNDQATGDLQELYNGLSRNGARILNLYRTVAQNPKVLRNFLRLGNSLLTGTELSAQLRELAILRVAKLAGSDYEWSQHVPIALETGIKKEQIEAIHEWKNSNTFSAVQTAVLQYTDEVALNVAVDDNVFDDLRKHLNDRSIVELTLSIGYWGMVARVLVPLKVELDDTTVGSSTDLLGRRNY